MNTPTQDTSWFENELAGVLTDKSSSKNYEKEFPFKAYIVDQFEGHTEDGYSCFRNYRTLDEAVAAARRITEEAILENGSVYRWHGEGDAGLVYHQDRLVWDGVREYTNAGGSEETLKALEYAINAHRGGFRKGSKIPYIVHPLGVAAILMRYNCANKLICCGYLHDTMEDTKVTFEDLKKDFGVYIAEIVKGLSELNQKDSWKDRKTHKIEYLKTAPEDVLIVSCADKLDNIRAIHRDLDSIGDELWKRFNATESEQKWYYSSLRDIFKSSSKSNAFNFIAQEFEQEVNAVFG